MKPSPFTRFEATLGREHRAKIEREVESGLSEAPKPRQRREPRAGRDGKFREPYTVPTSFTAAAALTAARNGSNTETVATGWLEHIARSGEYPHLAPEVQISVKIAIGGTFSRELYDEMKEMAAQQGVDLGDLGCRYIREGLAAHKAAQ